MEAVTSRPAMQAVNGIGVATLLTSPLWALRLMFPQGYTWEAGLFLVPAITAVNLFLLRHLTRRDREVGRVALVAYMLKLAATGAYMTVMFDVYGGGDAQTYFDAGTDLARQWGMFGFYLLKPIWSTNFLIMTAAVAVTSLGASFSALFVLFASVGFWGQFLLYRAFCIAFPEGRRTEAMLLTFFLPSLVFWPAMLGKEPLILFGIGLSCWGFARAVAKADPRGYVWLVAGLLATATVRPHVAVILGAAATVAQMFAQSRRGITGVIIKAAGIPVLLVASYFTIVRAQDFLSVTDLQSGEFMAQQVTRNSKQGGSSFEVLGSMPVRVALSPFFLVRPFPWEANNPQAFIAAAEALFIAYLLAKHRAALMRALLGWRSRPFSTFLFLYSLLFVASYGAITQNFGILTRMRVMVLCTLVLLLCGGDSEAGATLAPQSSKKPRAFTARRRSAVRAD